MIVQAPAIRAAIVVETEDRGEAIGQMKNDTVSTLPEDLSAVNVKAYIQNNFGGCGCWDYEAVCVELVTFLVWKNTPYTDRVSFSDLYPTEGVFYLIAGSLDRLELTDHGTSIRCGWLTDDGKRFLAALKKFTGEQIHDSGGMAYDGLDYKMT